MSRISQKFHILHNQKTHRLTHIPVLILMPHSACNCRCVMCDIWKANGTKTELAAETLRRHVEAFRKLGVEWIILSGGEPLLHRNLWALCSMLKAIGVRLTLLSSGLLLKQHAKAIARWVDEVIVSLDGSPEIHDRIRNVPRGFARMQEGIAALQQICPDLRICARSVVQKQNYFDLPGIIRTAKELKLHQLSFLAVDVTSSAFNRPGLWPEPRRREVMLSEDEVEHFAQILESVIDRFADDFASGFIAESPEKLRRMVRYFRALLGLAPFPPVRCNAPWVSAVLEADGRVRPCFFHPPYGTLDASTSFSGLLNGPGAIAFRKHLQVASDPTCQTCTCSLYIDPLQPIRRLRRRQNAVP